MQILISKYIDLISSNISESLSMYDPATNYSSGQKIFLYHSPRPELATKGDCSLNFFTSNDATYDATNTKYTWDGSQTAADDLYQDMGTDNGEDYLVQFEVTGRTAGSVSGLAGGTTGSAETADGVYQQIITAGADAKDGVQVSSDFEGSVKNISVKQISTVRPKKKYQSQQAQSGNWPATDDGTNWVYAGYSNIWKMFDEYTSSQTESNVAAGTIDVTIDSSKCNTIGLFNVVAKEFQVIVTDMDTSTELSNETYSLYKTSGTASAWDYFYADIERYGAMSVQIPIAYNTQAQVIITPTSGAKAKCGHMMAAKVKYIGDTRTDLEADIKTFSTISDNDFGETELVKRKSADKLKFDVTLARAAFDDVHQALKALDAVPVGFDVNNSSTTWTSLVMYGFIVTFKLVMPGADYHTCRLEIRELA